MDEKKTTENLVNEKLRIMSDAMNVEIRFAQDPVDNSVVKPAFNVDAIVSKIFALLVFSGVNIPSLFSPSYNCVHADVEFWKKYFSEIENPQETAAPDGSDKPQ